MRLERDHANSYLDVVVSAAAASNTLGAVVREWHSGVIDVLRAKAPGLEIACRALCYRCLARGRRCICEFPIKLGNIRDGEDSGARQRPTEELEDDDVWCRVPGEQPEPLDAARLLGSRQTVPEHAEAPLPEPDLLN